MWSLLFTLASALAPLVQNLAEIFALTTPHPEWDIWSILGITMIGTCLFMSLKFIWGLSPDENKTTTDKPTRDPSLSYLSTNKKRTPQISPQRRRQIRDARLKSRVECKDQGKESKIVGFFDLGRTMFPAVSGFYKDLKKHIVLYISGQPLDPSNISQNGLAIVDEAHKDIDWIFNRFIKFHSKHLKKVAVRNANDVKDEFLVESLDDDGKLLYEWSSKLDNKIVFMDNTDVFGKSICWKIFSFVCLIDCLWVVYCHPVMILLTPWMLFLLMYISSPFFSSGNFWTFGEDYAMCDLYYLDGDKRIYILKHSVLIKNAIYWYTDRGMSSNLRRESYSCMLAQKIREVLMLLCTNSLFLLSVLSPLIAWFYVCNSHSIMIIFILSTPFILFGILIWHPFVSLSSFAKCAFSHKSITGSEKTIMERQQLSKDGYQLKYYSSNRDARGIGLSRVTVNQFLKTDLTKIKDEKRANDFSNEMEMLRTLIANNEITGDELHWTSVKMKDDERAKQVFTRLNSVLDLFKKTLQFNDSYGSEWKVDPKQYSGADMYHLKLFLERCGAKKMDDTKWAGKILKAILNSDEGDMNDGLAVLKGMASYFETLLPEGKSLNGLVVIVTSDLMDNKDMDSPMLVSIFRLMKLEIIIEGGTPYDAEYGEGCFQNLFDVIDDFVYRLQDDQTKQTGEIDVQ